MKRYVKNIIFLLIAVMIFCCSLKDKNCSCEVKDGVTYCKNTGIPTGDYEPEVRFLFEITGPENVPDSMAGFGNIADLLVDENNYIYILDSEHATIKKFGPDGVFERYFPEQSGTGIQEFKNPTQFAALYDTLLIVDDEASKYVRYLNNGKYINSNMRFLGGGSFLYLNSDKRNNLTAFVPQAQQIDSVDYFTNNLTRLNYRFKPAHVIKEIRVPYDENFFFPDVLTSYTADKGLFYIADNMPGVYKIDIVNARGNLKKVIKMEHEKIPYNRYEKEMLNDFITSAGFPPVDTDKVIYKKAINSIHIDEKGRIWTQPSVERTEANQDSFYVDIFEQGCFVNRITLDFIGGNETYKLAGGRIFVISEDDRSVRVYEYQ